MNADFEPVQERHKSGDFALHTQQVARTAISCSVGDLCLESAAVHDTYKEFLNDVFINGTYSIRYCPPFSENNYTGVIAISSAAQELEILYSTPGAVSRFAQNLGFKPVFPVKQATFTGSYNYPYKLSDDEAKDAMKTLTRYAAYNTADLMRAGNFIKMNITDILDRACLLKNTSEKGNQSSGIIFGQGNIAIDIIFSGRKETFVLDFNFLDRITIRAIPGFNKIFLTEFGLEDTKVCRSFIAHTDNMNTIREKIKNAGLSGAHLEVENSWYSKGYHVSRLDQND